MNTGLSLCWRLVIYLLSHAAGYWAKCAQQVQPSWTDPIHKSGVDRWPTLHTASLRTLCPPRQTKYIPRDPSNVYIVGSVKTKMTHCMHPVNGVGKTHIHACIVSLKQQASSDGRHFGQVLRDRAADDMESANLANLSEKAATRASNAFLCPRCDAVSLQFRMHGQQVSVTYDTCFSFSDFFFNHIFVFEAFSNGTPPITRGHKA